MRIVRSAWTFFLLCLLLIGCNVSHTSPLLPFNFTISTDYKKIDFEKLTPEEKTVKLQDLFQDKLQFCNTHGIRRVLVRILDPTSFPFFNPDNFDSNRDDNFYFWAVKLNECVELEAVFDPSSFKLTSSFWLDYFTSSAKSFFKIESAYKGFHNLAEKFAWVSIVNESYDPSFNHPPLIKGVTINPRGLSDHVCQLLINALDQYRHNASSVFPPNRFPSLRAAAYFDLDQKDLAFANLSRFPLSTDLRTEKPNGIGITLTSAFPGRGNSLFSPDWRPNDNSPLLDHVYVNMADKRLVGPVYQNEMFMREPHLRDERGALLCSRNLSMSLRGDPIVKGPGKITILKGTNVVEGTYTFFRTGDIQNQGGRLIKNGMIEVRPPYTKEIMRRVIAKCPETNRRMEVTSSFSTTKDIVNADYYIAPLPVCWSQPMVSNALSSKIYFIFDCDFAPPEDFFMGNWGLENFLAFFKNSDNKGGFLLQPIFTDFSNTGKPPANNLVLHDFTTIPNGNPYPEINWGLGNGCFCR